MPGHGKHEISEKGLDPMKNYQDFRSLKIPHSLGKYERVDSGFPDGISLVRVAVKLWIPLKMDRTFASHF